MSGFWTIVGVLVLWYALGCFVLAWADDEKQNLFNWASAAPLTFLYILVILLWPWTLYWWRQAQKDGPITLRRVTK